MLQLNNNFLALDVGSVRIGVAIATAEARIARPLKTLLNDGQFWNELQTLIEREAIGQLVIGLPRNLDGDATNQTEYVEDFVKTLSTHTMLPVTLQDEALTSRLAEEELERRGKPYKKAEVDALAACIILTDYLSQEAARA